MNIKKDILKKFINSSLVGMAATMLMPISAYAAIDVYDESEYDPILVFENYNSVLSTSESAESTSTGEKGTLFYGRIHKNYDYVDRTNDYDWSDLVDAIGGGSQRDEYGYKYGVAKINTGTYKIKEIANHVKIAATSSYDWDPEERFMYVNIDADFLLENINKTAENHYFATGALSRYDGQYIEGPSHYPFIVEEGDPKIYPDSYEDVVVQTREEFEAVFPWLKEYPDGMTRSERQEVFNRYEGSKYFNKEWVNATLGVEYLTKDITSYRNVPTSVSSEKNIKLDDYIDTLIPREAIAQNKGSNYMTGDQALFIRRDGYLTSTWEISTDLKTWYTIGTSKDQGYYKSTRPVDEYREISGDRFTYDMFEQTIKLPTEIDSYGDVVYTEVNVKDVLGDTSSFFIRRRSSATGILSTYNNITSPPRRIRPQLSIDKIEAKYVGEAVTQGMYADPADIEIRVWYSDRNNLDEYTAYKGNQPFVTVTGLEIYNVGNNNFATWEIIDPRTGEIRSGEVSIPGKEPDPVSISATYQGDPVVEDTAYNPTQVRVQITYNNGDISTYSGSSLSVGVTTTNKYDKSDVDLNTVVNQNDLKYLEMALNGETLTSQQRAQADTNGDGKVDNTDYDYVAKLIDRTVPLGDKIFYASYSNLFDAKTNKLQYASFKIPSERKKPYKLIVTMKPLKTKYVEGEDFDPTGMILNVFYNNGTVKVITYANKDDNIEGITLGNKEYPAKNMKSDQTILPISYTENGETVETELNLNVSLKTLTSIKITTPPETTTYYAGQNFDRTGMEVTAFYDELNNDYQTSSTILNDRDYDVENDRRLKDSRNYIVIEADDPADIETGYLRVMKSNVISPQTFDNGTHATFKYLSGGTEKTLEGTIVGNNFVTVTYTDRGITKKAYQPIDVLERKLVAVEIEQMPYKTTYSAGDSFDTTGLILKATYTDGSSEFIYEKTADRNGYEVVNPDNLTSDRKEVVVQYTENGFTSETVVPIEVNDPTLESLKAVYMGPNVYINYDFDPHDVIITATYTNHVDAFRGDDKNADGTDKFTFKNEAGVISLNVTKIGENKFTVEFGGKTADFIVTGVKKPDQIDFSGSVAKSKRKWAKWTEEFKAIKIQSVADYINGKVNDLPIDVITADEYHVVEKTNVTEDRTLLTEYNGTAKIPDFTDPNKVVSPLLSFMREGTWRQPETEISVQYRTRTKGYLFPETPNAMWAADESYLDAYEQNRDRVWAGNQGWSDWYYDGDSSGTVYGDRIAYNYDLDANPVTDTETMFMDALQIRLTGYRNGDNPALNVTVQDVNGNTRTFNGINETMTIESPSKIKIDLAGQITVTDDHGQAVRRNFADVYKVYYRSTTDELTQWSETGEWTGTDGIRMQNLEIRLMLKDANFDKGSSSERPIFSQHPKNTSAVIGDRVIFTVSAVGQTLTYQWYSDKGGTAAPITGATSASYRTPELTTADNGVHYWCVVNNGLHSAESSKALLTVNDIFPIITQNPADVTAEVGSTETFTVAATCKDPSTLHYTWQIRNGSSWDLLPGTVDSPNIVIQLTEDMHGKDIRCKVENSRGYTYSNAARINCKKAPEVEITSTTDYVLAGRQNVRFNANVLTSSGNEIFTWEVDGVKQSTSSAVFTYKPEETGDHEIRCVVTDNFGTGEDTKTIHVGTLPEVTLSQKEETATDGSKTITITANVKASNNGGTLLYKWAKDAVEVEDVTGSEYKLTGLKAGEQYSITCTVQDQFGMATGVTNIIIQ